MLPEVVVSRRKDFGEAVSGGFRDPGGWVLVGRWGGR